MSLAAIEARARSKMSAADPKARARRYAAAESARRVANLKAEGFVVPLSEWLGHNNGPAWDEWEFYLDFCWRKSHERVWTPPTPEVGIRRVNKAAALGLTYRQYVLEIMERGRYLDEEGAAALRANKKAILQC